MMSYGYSCLLMALVWILCRPASGSFGRVTVAGKRRRLTTNFDLQLTVQPWIRDRLRKCGLTDQQLEGDTSALDDHALALVKLQRGSRVSSLCQVLTEEEVACLRHFGWVSDMSFFKIRAVYKLVASVKVVVAAHEPAGTFALELAQCCLDELAEREIEAKDFRGSVAHLLERLDTEMPKMPCRCLLPMH